MIPVSALRQQSAHSLTIEDESGWVEHKQHDLIMKMTTDHFVESTARLGKATAVARNRIHLLAGLQMADSSQVLNRLVGRPHRHNMVDEDAPAEVVNDNYHLQECNLVELRPLEPLVSEVDIRSHSSVVNADNNHHYRVDHSKMVDIEVTMLQLVSSVAAVSQVLRKRSCIKLINNKFN
jgi:hypothetical protein